MPNLSDTSCRAILLVGFMASGKSTVGALVARHLGWDFVDVDTRLEERFGMSVQEIFREHGEERFRRAEEEVTRQALQRPGRVVASGGGWGGVPGRVRELDPGVLTVWLRVRPRAAVERADADAGTRPLLTGDDPVERARRLLAERTPAYRDARLHLDSGGASPERLALTIVEYLAEGGLTGADPDADGPNQKTQAPPSGAP